MAKDPNSHLRRAKTSRQSTPDEVRANRDARANQPKPSRKPRKKGSAKRAALRQEVRLNKSNAEISKANARSSTSASAGGAVNRTLTPLEKKALKAEYKERARIRKAAEQYEATRKHYPKRKKKVWVKSIVSSGFETNRKKH